MSGGATQSNSVSKPPAWLRPQMKFGVQEARRLYDTQGPPPRMSAQQTAFLQGQGQTGVIDPTIQNYQRTMSGEYLQGSPYQSAVLDRALNAVRGNVGAGFGGSGRYGSGQWASSLADSMTGTAANYLDQNYQAERDRMGQYSAMGQGILDLGQGAQQALTDEQTRQWAAPQDALNNFLNQLYGNPSARNTQTTTQKKSNWLDYVGAIGSMAGGMAK